MFSPEDAPETSVVIRAFNEERHIGALFDALRRQTYQDCEVLVVDSGSFDRTVAIAESAGATLVHIESSDFTFGHSLNVGVEHARGRFVVMISAHAEPVQDSWLQLMVEPLRDDDVAMSYGRQLGGGGSKLSEALDFERDFGSAPLVLRAPDYNGNNANAAIRRDLWEVHPYDESLTGLEDIEWAKYWMDRGKRLVYEPDASVFHHHDETWEQVRRRFHREGVAWRRMNLRSASTIPSLVVGEVSRCISDLGTSFRQGNLGERGAEILAYRWNRFLGSAGGVMDSDARAPLDDPAAFYFDRGYRAVEVADAGQASLISKELPTPRPGEVVIRVAYTGVCGTDLEILDGSLGYYQSGLATYPIVPGHEFSGRVAEVGPNVEHLEPGAPVVAECIQSCGVCSQCSNQNWIGCAKRKELGVFGRDGAYADYVVVPGQFVQRLPDDLDLLRATLCEPTAVVLKGIRRARLGDGEARCAVVGAGPIGHICCLLLREAGHQVIAFDQDARRLAPLRRAGIETGEDAAGASDVDVIVEATGDPSALETVLSSSRAGASILLLGLPYARREFSFEHIVANDKTVIGSVGSGAADFREAIRILPTLPIDALLEATMPLERYAEAWESFRRREFLKVILQIGGDADVA